MVAKADNRNSQKPSTSLLARPFLKWAGGKQQLLSRYEAYLPESFTRYFEPFAGGGALFFHLYNMGRLPQRAYLLDSNEELVNVYVVVRDQVEALMALLAIHQKNHSREYYYWIRSLDRVDVELGRVEKAARTIYLNRTCYNGLYRVNRKKQFNVPVGSYKNPRILQENRLRAASAALQGAQIETRDFRTAVDVAQSGDFFYFDPPYVPVSKSASFTSYTASSFGREDQEKLATVFTALSRKGCYCMLSNSYTSLVLQLYREFRIETIDAKRAINSNGNGRGHVKEVVILNY